MFLTSSRIMMVYSSPGRPPLQVTWGLSAIWPVSMVSPTPGENRGHCSLASWAGGEASLEGTTWLHWAGSTLGEALEVTRPGSTPGLVLSRALEVVTAGPEGWEGPNMEPRIPGKCQ